MVTVTVTLNWILQLPLHYRFMPNFQYRGRCYQFVSVSVTVTASGPLQAGLFLLQKILIVEVEVVVVVDAPTKYER